MSRPTLTLPFWMAGENALKIVTTCERWWELVASWLQLSLAINPETAVLSMVDLIAWERNIQRLDNEPEAWYRSRVKYALANAKDAGTANGLKRIFDRMGMPAVSIRERLPQYDWDQVEIGIKASELVGKASLFDVLLRKYFPTCRRFIYALEAETAPVHVACVSISGSTITVYPKQES